MNMSLNISNLGGTERVATSMKKLLKSLQWQWNDGWNAVELNRKNSTNKKVEWRLNDGEIRRETKTVKVTINGEKTARNARKMTKEKYITNDINIALDV